jgi:hypothetical protein
MVIAPLIVTILTGLGLALKLLRDWNRNMHLCRTVSLHLQVERAAFLNTLLHLNPKAEHLRVQYHRALRALKAARATGNPVAIAAAEATVAYYFLQRQKLDVRQKSILMRAEALIPPWRQSVRTRLHTDTAFINSARLSVAPIPPRDLAPSYIPDPRTETLQRTFAGGEVSPPMWQRLALAFGIQVPTVQWACGSTLRKKGQIWNAGLAPAMASATVQAR